MRITKIAVLIPFCGVGIVGIATDAPIFADVAVKPVPALSSCSAYGPTRTSTQVVGTTRCTAGTGTQKARLTIRTAVGNYLSDSGPCVSRGGYSQAVIDVPWYQGGPSRATVVGFGPLAC